MPKKPKKSKSARVPAASSHDPAAIAQMAEAMPSKSRVRFSDVEAYAGAITKLHERGYSYEEIAQWLNERLAGKLNGRLIKRAQVYRVHQQSLPAEFPGHKEFEVPNISDEEAEAKAADSDKKPR